MSGDATEKVPSNVILNKKENLEEALYGDEGQHKW